MAEAAGTMKITAWWANLFIVMFVLMGNGSSLSAEEIYQLYEELLRAHVTQGLVDYQGFKKDEQKLDNYLEKLNKTNPELLADKDKLAFYINAYNGYTIKLILDNFKNDEPPVSIKKIGGFFSSPWKISFAHIDGHQYSLDTIEHDIIRKQFDEPRIHFAVNCASRSCPPLIAEPYNGASLEYQLEQSTRNFLADRDMNYLDGDTLYVSSIFKWYSDDFDNDPVSFFLAHTDGGLHEQIKSAGSGLSIEYIDYDWSLNGN